MERYATKKQCYAIYCLLHKDVRNTQLTIDEANKLIAEVIKNKNNNNNSRNNKLSLRNQFINYYKDNIHKVVEVAKEQFGIKSIVSNDNQYMTEKKSYAFVGYGCGIVYFTYRKNNKKAAEIDDLYLELCGSFNSTVILKMFLSYFDKKTIKYYENIGCPIQALFHQNLPILMKLHRIAIDFAKERGINMDMEYRDD